MDLKNLSFTEITAAIQSQKISAKEVMTYFLERIEKLNPQINAVTFVSQTALQEAEKLDQKIAKGEKLGPLGGVPFGIKEMLCTKGLPSTAASKILSNFIPPYDSTVVSRLKAADAIVIGKLNQDEFAMGSSNETSYFGPTKNPWKTECTPGGSSGGSAAATASRLMPGTIGTDTGGSIRQPASFCGIVGVKPTYGRVSRYGIIAYASSLDQAGPMTKNVPDAALTLEAISGFDEMDSTSSQKPVPAWSKNLSDDVRGLKIGLLKEFMQGPLDSDVQKTVDNSLQALRSMGAEIVDVSIPFSELAVPVYYLIASSEASSNLARYDGVRYGFRSDFKNLGALDLETFYSQTRGEGFGPEVKRRIMLGTYFLSSGYFDAYYQKASQVRRLLTQQFHSAFQKCDVILSPVTTAPAFRIGEKISDPLAMYLNDIFTTSANLAGLPGMSVPFGMSSEKLPIGVQLLAAPFEEQKMLNVAFALEKASSIQSEVPNVI